MNKDQQASSWHVTWLLKVTFRRESKSKYTERFSSLDEPVTILTALNVASAGKLKRLTTYSIRKEVPG